jgi:hypothetical protein
MDDRSEINYAYLIDTRMMSEEKGMRKSVFCTYDTRMMK